MLKKTGIVVAAVTAGLLAASPLAFANHHDVHQEKHQRSFEHNGFGEGGTAFEPNSGEVCNINGQGGANAFGQPGPGYSNSYRPGDCTSGATANGSNTTQKHVNSDDGGNYDD